MTKDKVSIIVPCYNQSEYISETLESVLNQTYTNWECIIVNDGSTDSSEEIAQSYCKRDERFRYFLQPNSGPSVARNTGIGNSEGEYILPLDADDIMEQTYVEKAIQQFKKQPDTKLVFCKSRYFGGRTGEFPNAEYNYEDFIWRRFLIIPCAMYKRIDYNKTTGYNPNMVIGMEDFDFWVSLIGPQDSVYMIPEVLFNYRIKEMSRDVISQKTPEVSLRQTVMNHLDVYEPYFERLFDYPYLVYKIKKYENSITHRMAVRLLKPLVVFRDFLSKNN